MKSEIFELIGRMEEEIKASPKSRLQGGSKKSVDADQLLELLSELKVVIPNEVRAAMNLLADKEHILAQARDEAARMLAEARQQREKLVSSEAILEESRKRAEGIVQRAEHNAALITDGARNYTDEILLDLQRYLKEYTNIIEKNRKELHMVYAPQQEQPLEEAEEQSIPAQEPALKQEMAQGADAPAEDIEMESRQEEPQAAQDTGVYTRFRQQEQPLSVD
jgi:hypothetical protein